MCIKSSRPPGTISGLLIGVQLVNVFYSRKRTKHDRRLYTRSVGISFKMHDLAAASLFPVNPEGLHVSIEVLNDEL